MAEEWVFYLCTTCGAPYKFKADLYKNWRQANQNHACLWCHKTLEKSARDPWATTAPEATPEAASAGKK